MRKHKGKPRQTDNLIVDNSAALAGKYVFLNN
jgi:hypothetical protein